MSDRIGRRPTKDEARETVEILKDWNTGATVSQRLANGDYDRVKASEIEPGMVVFYKDRWRLVWEVTADGWGAYVSSTRLWVEEVIALPFTASDYWRNLDAQWSLGDIDGHLVLHLSDSFKERAETGTGLGVFGLGFGEG